MNSSIIDPYLFIADKVTCLFYIDDCLMYARNKEEINGIISGTKEQGFTLKVEDNAAGFLAFDLERQYDSSI